MSFPGIGGYEVIVLLVIALAVVVGLHLVVRATVASGVRRADRDERLRGGERRG